MNEAKVIALIREGKHERAFARLYRYYPKIEKHICINSGSREEALDIFQDALVVLHRKLSDGSKDVSFSCEGFLVTTCKLLWSNELRKKKVRQTPLGLPGGEKSGALDEDITQHIEKENQYKAIEDVLQKLGEKCRNILEQFYFHAVSMERIAELFGFKTVESAKVQKYKCIETARKMALENYVSDQSFLNELSEDTKSEQV